jgi:hypothetical protein
MAIPKEMRQKYDEIAPLIIEFCDKNLNAEFKGICLRLLEKLCRKRPSPVLGGKARTWAAGIVYAICQNNFIFDKSQEFSMTAAELAEPFGIAPSTAGNKAAEIRKYIKISYMTPEWTLNEITDSNPLTWMVELDGLPIDVRMLPVTLQRQAYAKGLIPYVPGDKEDEEAQGEPDEDAGNSSGQAFELLVSLDMHDFEVWRKITVPAGITFKQLHIVIQSSFNWLTYHMFDFCVFDNSDDGKPVALISDSGNDISEQFAEQMKIYTSKTKLAEFLPKYKRVLYTYDYGDDWRHLVELLSVIDDYGKDYPMCLDGKGDAPPEDVGGEPGYADFLEAINERTHPDHSDMIKWGKSQRFESFDIDKVNMRLKKALLRKK